MGRAKGKPGRHLLCLLGLHAWMYYAEYYFSYDWSKKLCTRHGCKVKRKVYWRKKWSKKAD